MFLSTIILQWFLLRLVNTQSEHPILLVISFDGFRYDFFDKEVTPHLEKLKKEGTYADYIYSVFPTKTFPNHHSIATGFYTETHGVIANSFYDPILSQVIGYGYDMFHYDDDIVPIWRLNEKLGKGRYSGIMMWPGGTFAYQDEYATYLQAYEPSFDWYKRVDTVISWMRDSEKPANLIMMYFEEPDTHSHAFGPESRQVREMLEKLDNITGYLEEQLEHFELKDKVNIIQFSDHGMSTVKPPQFLNLSTYLEPDTYTTAGVTPALHYIPKDGSEDDVYNRLKAASKELGHFNVYKKKDLPERWHFKNNPRTPPIFVLGDEGYGFQDLADSAQKFAWKYHFKLFNTSEFGVHGYDNMLEDMRPFFMARGPKIKEKYRVTPFHVVDLFPLFCEILEIPEIPTNGSLANVHDMLISTRGYSFVTTLILAAIGLYSLLRLMIFYRFGIFT